MIKSFRRSPLGHNYSLFNYLHVTLARVVGALPAYLYVTLIVSS